MKAWLKRNWEILGVVVSAIGGMLIFIALFPWQVLAPWRLIPYDNPARIIVYLLLSTCVGITSAFAFLLILALKERRSSVR